MRKQPQKLLGPEELVDRGLAYWDRDEEGTPILRLTPLGQHHELLVWEALLRLRHGDT